jgi:hypothetical protein
LKAAVTTSPLARWAGYDAEHAVHPTDRDAIAATEAARALVIELASAGGRDHFTACARLGALLAAHGASPSLAANTIDGASRALAEAGVALGERVAPARASVIEGYVAWLRDAERAAASARWDYPACAVPLEDGAVAIACGHPCDDADALSAWAGRVIGQLVKANARRLVLAGPERARAEIANAAASVGIEVGGGARRRVRDGAPTTEPRERAADRGRSWLRLPWRK